MYSISNRRYTGSKYKLLDWIEELIEENCKGETFFDVFAGTGVVSDRMKSHFSKIYMNDFLYSNETIYKAFYGEGKFRKKKLEEYKQVFQSLKAEKIKDNYFSKNFGGKYFSNNDAKLIGRIREDIEKNKENLSDKEYRILIASLLYSADKVANTVGHYDAYRKIKHIDDRFVYDLIDVEDSKCKFVIYREDSNELARKIESDIAFVDPPYNSRQYSRFYHILENITKWEKPSLEGTALKPPAENMSEYCRSSAPDAFADLIENLNVKYIVVTYNNTYNSKSNSSKNKITLEEIKEILEKKGYTRSFSKHHQFFNAGKTDFDDHKEYVFITEVGCHEGDRHFFMLVTNIN